MRLVDLYVLAKPDGADDASSSGEGPVAVVPLADGLPCCVIVVCRCEVLLDAGVAFVEQFPPLLVSLLVSLHLCLDEVWIVIEACLGHERGIVQQQTVGRDPCLNGGAAPAVDDDTLRDLCLFQHPFAEEIADGGKEPRILFVDGLPVDSRRGDVIPYTMRVGLVLHTEHSDLVALKMVDFIGILRIDTLDGHVDVRLSREQPHVTY